MSENDLLETDEGCNAHRALAICVRQMKETQRERTETLVEMNKTIQEKVSTRLFLFAVLVLLGFLSYNAVTNIGMCKDLPVFEPNYFDRFHRATFE